MQEVQTADRPLAIERWPETDAELWHFVALIWDREIPHERCCPNHTAPFEAFADAYFARSRVAVWKASRGFGGKSTLLALLAQTESVCLGASVTILGGSGQQSKRVLEEISNAWNRDRAPRSMLIDEPTKQIVRLSNGGKTEALMASQASVRGPHPQRLRLDEVDEMKRPIFDASLGQTMSKDGIAAQTVMSSTHQYADGTMTYALKEASSKGWPIYEWCYKDTARPRGWITETEIAEKRIEMPEAMWLVEVELQEPSAEGLAFNRDAVERMFDLELGKADGRDGEYVEFEPPQIDAMYVTGADWGKMRDWTIIVTFRADTEPWRLVAFERTGRIPWGIMVGKFDSRVQRYKGLASHDATGHGGNVVADDISVEAEGFEMTGKKRTHLFTEYMSGIEKGEIVAPRIDFMYNEHKYCTNHDLFYGGHPPDSVVAAAIAWRMRKNIVRSGIMPQGVGSRVAAGGW